jgi:hypothetical protein
MVSPSQCLWASPDSNQVLGKQWHAPRAAFRPKMGNDTYEKRQHERVAMAAMKAKEKEMKEEKEAERVVRKQPALEEILQNIHLRLILYREG